jgi:hypothetical protein
MGGEGAGIWLGIPLLAVLLLILLKLVSFIEHRPEESEHGPESAGGERQLDTSNRTLGLGRSRIATGYLAAMFALVPIVLLLARQDLGVAILAVLMFVPLLVLLLTIVGLPLIALLRRLGVASGVGFTLSCGLIGLLTGMVFDWTMWASALVAVVLAAAFSVGSRLPLLKSASMQANKSLERSRER